MNCSEVMEHLADYLGDELDEPRRRSFDAHLESCHSCSLEVQSMSRVLAELSGAPVVSADQAMVRTQQLEVRLRPSRSRRLLSGLLRYAAMLFIGAGVGWALKPATPGAAPGGPVADSPPPKFSTANDVHPEWVEAVVQASRRHSGGSSFVRNIAALSVSGKGP